MKKFTTVHEIIEWWKAILPPEDLIRRDIEISEYLSEKIRKILVIYGIRRCGKTYILYQILDELNKSGKSTFYLDMSDERMDLFSGEEIFSSIEERPEEIPVLDEVQEVKGWEKFLNRLLYSGRKTVVVGGSSSVFTPENLPKVLRGRTLPIRVFPLSFREFIRFKKKRKHSQFLLLEFLEFGSMPEVALVSSKAKKMMMGKEYYWTIIVRDAIEKHRIRKKEEFKIFSKLIIRSSSFSSPKMEKNLRSIGAELSRPQILKFAGYLQDSFLLHLLPLYSKSYKTREQHPKKVYVEDNIFLRVLGIERKGRLLENLVAVELLRRGFEPGKSLFYWKSAQGYEVDFVLLQGTQVKQLIQVAYSLEDEKTRRRELRALVKASRELGCNDLLVLTWDEEGKEKVEGKEIKLVPVWRWLLQARV